MSINGEVDIDVRHVTRADGAEELIAFFLQHDAYAFCVEFNVIFVLQAH
jgi:hypothetical protein